MDSFLVAMRFSFRGLGLTYLFEGTEETIIRNPKGRFYRVQAVAVSVVLCEVSIAIVPNST